MESAVMAKKPETASDGSESSDGNIVLRLPAEVIYGEQLEALRQSETELPPASWKLSPRSVLSYIIGGKSIDATIGGKKKKVEITRKFFGETAIVERAIVT